MYKISNGLVPNYLTKRFNICNNQNHNLGNNIKLALAKPNTNFITRSFSYRGAVSWNNLGSELINKIKNLSLNGFISEINELNRVDSQWRSQDFREGVAIVTT